ncbi:MAG: RIP metalloprotease RseP [Cardiobacteriaceae bacterium]|nr:RIP metalloprotease RseP [Cardiobacteriaceae bacterium]
MNIDFVSILWGILGFVITIGIMVTIHEWGHFIVARYFDVKILRFSVGFGKPLLTWKGKKDATEYTLAPIPLGGFVQMLGEDAKKLNETELSEEDKKRTFIAKPAWQRFLIAFAGPFVNFIFAVIAFACLFISGVDGLKPEVLYVAENSIAAESGIQAGDVIVGVNGRRVKLAVDYAVALADAGHSEKVEIEYSRRGQLHKGYMNFSSLKAGDELHLQEVIGLYGIEKYSQAAIVYDVIADKPAEKMGLKKGDEIIAVNGKEIPAGIARFVLSEEIAKSPNQAIELTVIRGKEEIKLSTTVGISENNPNRGYLGFYYGFKQPDFDFFARYGITERYGIFTSIAKGFDKTIYYMKVTYLMLGRLVTRDISPKNMGGPLTIGDIAGKTIRIGGDIFFNFLGLVSLSLAVINLLPIPMLDGGHLLLCTIEMLRGGKPLPEKMTQWLYYLGATVVFSFMALVIFYDILKYI